MDVKKRVLQKASLFWFSYHVSANPAFSLHALTALQWSSCLSWHAQVHADLSVERHCLSLVERIIPLAPGDFSFFGAFWRRHWYYLVGLVSQFDCWISISLLLLTTISNAASTLSLSLQSNNQMQQIKSWWQWQQQVHAQHKEEGQFSHRSHAKVFWKVFLRFVADNRRSHSKVCRSQH